MAKYTTLMRVKLDAKTRHLAGEVIELSAKAAAPLLAAGAIKLDTSKAKADADAQAAADAAAAKAKADAEAKA